MVNKMASPVPLFCPQIEQRIEPAKRAAHSVSKKLQACLQGQCGSEMDKRVVRNIFPAQAVLTPALSLASSRDARPLLCQLCSRVAQSYAKPRSHCQQWPPACTWDKQSRAMLSIITNLGHC